MQHLYSAVRGWLLPLLAVLLLGTGPARAQTAATKVFWVQSSGTATDDRLVSTNLNGSGQATLASGNSTTTFANPNALWVDAANGVIYVGDGANSGTTGISRFTSGGVFVNTIVAGVAGVSITGLHVVGSRLYWVQSSGTATDDRLVSANLDGSGVTVLASGASSFDNPNALWVDAANGVIYVGDGPNAATTGIRAFNLSGTLLNTIVPGVSGTGINALQVAGGKLYWVQSSSTAANDQLASANLDGTNKAVLASGNSAATFANPNSLRVDVPNGVIYVGDGAAVGSTGISRFSLTGTYLSTIVAGGGLFSFNGLATNEAAAVAPTVTTAAATTVSATSAVLGGDVTADGAAAVTERGVVYSSSATTPAIGGTSVTQNTNGTGTGPFSETIAGLTASTTYYVRAYATNSAGTSYGAVISFTTTAPVNGTTVVTNVSCNGGTNGAINLTPTGGLAPYTFLWNNGATTEDLTGLTAGSYSVTITDATGATGTVNSIIVTQPSAISATTSQTNIACNGGSTGAASVSPAGGTSPYTYLWSTGATTQTITGLTAGTYSVVITDANGCTNTRNFTITQPANAVNGTTVVTNVSCNGGTNGAINLTPTGGTGPYTFNWGGGITTEDRTGLTAGTYAVIITDANGCTRTVSSITVTQPPALAVTPASQTNIACNGGATGSASINTPTGGTAPYTYNWMPGNPAGDGTRSVTGLSAGTYSVTVTDANGCTGSTSFTISQPATALTATTSQTDVTTNGGNNGSATITVSGGTPGYTYSWSPNVSTTATASNLSAGTYSVTATDANGCTIARSFTITQPSTATVVSVTRLMPSPTATAQVQYRVVFSGSVSGVTVSNFNVANTGSVSGTNVSSVVGSGTTYTVTVNTGTGDGTLRLNVANSTGISPTLSNVPYTAGEVYAIIKNFAAQPQLVVRGAGSPTGISDVTAFVDVVQVLSGGTVFSNGLTNNSFESSNVPAGSFHYAYAIGSLPAVTATPWLFSSNAGIARSGSGFGPVVSDGDAVAFVQTTTTNNGGVNAGSGSFTQSVAVPTGTTYQVSFVARQRGASSDQVLNVFLNNGADNVFIGTIQPGTSAYSPFTSATFAVTAPALTAAISSSAGSNGSNTSTSPIPFAVTFSASATGFDASDVTVGNGSISGFTGSGTTYSFNVTPAANGAVTVSVPANGALDANNTGNTAAGPFTINYTQLVTAAPVITLPANNTLTNQSVSISGTAPAGSDVTVYVSQNGTAFQDLGTYTATAGGTFTTPAFPLPSSTYQTYATAQSPGAAVSANSNTVTFTVDQTRPAVTLTSTSGASGSTNVAAPFAFTATFSENVTGFVAGDLSVSNGTISGFTGSGTTYTFTVTPTTLGTVTTVAVFANSSQDAAGNGNTGSPTYALTSSAPTITVAPATLPGGAVGTAYSQTLTASGGTAPYTYAITAGALPAGLTLTSAGLLSGTATAGGTFNFTVRATDASATPGPYNGSRAYSLLVSAPVIAVSPTTLPNGTAATAYSQTVTASGGTAPYAFAVTAGALPTGLTLTSAGTLAGTPTANGTFAFTVTATDASTGAGPYSGSRAYTLTVSAQPVTAAPVVTTPANSSLLSTTTPAYGGTAPAGSTVTVFVDGTSIGTTTATADGDFALTQPAALAQGSHTVYATAQTNGEAVSANSNTNTFTVDTTAPTVAISSTVGASGSNTTTTPIPFTATFSENVTGFVAGDLSVSNGTIGTVSGSGTTYTFNVTPTTAGTATTVNVPAAVAQDGAGNFNTAASSAYSLTYLPTAVTWNGSISSDWFTAGNWTPAVVPTPAIDASIPASAPNMPAIGANTANVRNLNINSGATLTQTGGTLMLAANLTNNGTYQPTGGTASLGGTALSSILGSSNTRFWNLTVDANGAQSSTSASTSVQRLFALTGNFTTNGNPLTLESNATNTALVNNSNGGVITGNATFQRYISPATNPGLGYRHYSAPVSNATVASLTTASFTPVVNPNYNASATPNSVRPFPTVYYYDQAHLATSTNSLAPFDKGWTSPSALTDPLTVGKGYTVNLTANQTLAVTGPQNNGTVTQALSRTTTFPLDAGWQLLGNPFPSPLDYSLVAPADRINLNAAIYVFASTNQYNGQYRSYVNGVGGDPILAQGQGFFARVTNGQTTGLLTLRNAHRVTAYQNPVYQRGTANRPLVQLDLQGATQADPLYVYFENGATAGVDPEFDAVKLPNTTGLNLAAGAGPDQLAINGLPLTSTASVTVPLFIGLPATGTYTLHAAQVLNFGAGEQPFLRDLQLGTLTDLSLTPNYTFTMNAANTTPRFELVFGARVLGVASAKLAAQVAVYPNPASKAVFVELPYVLNRKAVTAALVDALGRVVLTQALPAGQPTYTLPLTNLATGVYSLRLQTEAGVVVKKLVVE